MEKGFSIFALALAMLLAVSSSASTSTAANTGLSEARVPGEIVIQLKGRAGEAKLRTTVLGSLQRRLGAASILAVRTFQTDDTLQTIKLARDQDVAAAIAALREEPGVAYAEPNFLYHAFEAALPNDTDLAKLWGMNNTGQTDTAGQVGTPGSDIKAAALWEQGITGSRRITVAIIDTGVDWTHPDLVDNLYTNPGETGDNATNGKDDDGNGFVDDTHGWNFAGKNRNSSDDHDHGTHCAGTIGGVGNNGQGVAGVNWQVSILPIKFLTAQGSGSLEDAVEAINYARKMKVNVMSNSWGGGGFSKTMEDAIKKAKDDGILFIAAAGNEKNNNDAKPSYPATYAIDNVISVAATDNKDQIASFSNWGVKTVHVAAPGVKIYSTTKGGKYSTFSGTSMACPHVAGIAALMMAHNGDWSIAEIKKRLITTSDPVRGLKNKVLAKGRVNALAAINNTVPPSTDPDPALWREVPYNLESEHPYKLGADQLFTIQQPGAKYIRVVFEKVEVEENYDKVFVQDATGNVADELTGNHAARVSEYVTGDTLVVRLKADDNVNEYGFKISKIQVIR